MHSFGHLPDLSTPYRQSGKVEHRAWFSQAEYKTLYEATRANIKAQQNKRHIRLAEQLHDKILFMANTGIRPDEANWLEYRDVEIVDMPHVRATMTRDPVSAKQHYRGDRGKHDDGCEKYAGSHRVPLRLQS